MEFIFGFGVGAIAMFLFLCCIVYSLNLEVDVKPHNNQQLNINIVHIDDRVEYTLKDCSSPLKVVFKSPDFLTLTSTPSSPYFANQYVHFTPQYIEGRDEMKLLRAALNDIAKVDKRI